jgi:hypothetical protein
VTDEISECCLIATIEEEIEANIDLRADYSTESIFGPSVPDNDIHPLTNLAQDTQAHLPQINSTSPSLSLFLM